MPVYQINDVKKKSGPVGLTFRSHLPVRASMLKYHVLMLMILLCPGINAQKKKVHFNDVAGKAGIGFMYTFGDYTYVNILESSGSGITVFDYNNDNLMDIYMLNGTFIDGISDPEGRVFRDSKDCLFRNNGNGTFTDVTHSAGLDDPLWSMAAGASDYDNDGDQDLYLMNYGPNKFFRNNGNGTFTDITSKLGMAGPDTLNGFTKWSIGAAFWDYNLDGRMDVMVGNFLAFNPAYVSPVTPGLMPHPSEYRGQASMLYRQEPDGSFTDVTNDAGLYYPNSKCMGLTIFDYDNDGDLDIFQANDHHFNYLFRNDGGGKYTEVAVASGVAANSKGVGTGSMHASIGDVDGDGLIDILVTDLEYGALYRNTGNGIFTDITESSGVAGQLIGKGSWGGSLFDYDNDGDLDLIAANGNGEALVLQYPVLLENDGKGYFRNAGPGTSRYFTEKRSGRGLAVLDYDNDGDLDVMISHVDLKASASLLRNDGGNSGNWLGLTLRGKNGPASAIGAKVVAISGDMRNVFVNQWVTSYLSVNDPRLHIGLGPHRKIDRLEITWPGGQVETYNDIAANRYITIMQGNGIIN